MEKNGMSHAFVVEFASAEDRDYYVLKDPVHQAFVRSLDGIVEKAQVIDFTDGVFWRKNRSAFHGYEAWKFLVLGVSGVH